jgi:hypothetical protein
MPVDELMRKRVVLVEPAPPPLVAYFDRLPRGVEMSVNMTVARMRSRSVSPAWRWPVTNSSMSPTSVSVSPVQNA